MILKNEEFINIFTLMLNEHLKFYAQKLSMKNVL